MTREELMTMDDADLVAAIGEKLDRKFEAENELTGPEIVVYTLYLFDQEVQNGGLNQFFCNSSSEMAPFVPSSLLNVEADEYEALLAHFLDETAMELDSLDDADDEKYAEAYGEFDDAYYAMYSEQPLDEMTAAYIRAHADVFVS